MRSLFCYIFLTIGGCLIVPVHPECVTSKCEAFFPGDALRQLKMSPPSEESLLSLCPSLFEYIECTDDLITDCTGRRLAQLSFSDDKIVASNTTLLLNMKGIVLELCTQHTKLHRDYVASVDCFKRVMRHPDAECYREQRIISRALQLRTNSAESRQRRNESDECFMRKALADCYNIQLQERCSTSASDVFVRIRSAVRPFAGGFCSWTDLQNLKTGFLSFLRAEGDKRVSFSGGRSKNRKNRNKS